MIGQAPQTEKIAGDDIFRGYSIARRDQAPLIETEDFRDEAARGIWDDFSPPHFGFKPKAGRPAPAARPGPGQRHLPLEFRDLLPRRRRRYANYVPNRIDNPDPAHSKWSAYASIYWSDSDADGRQQSSEVLRVSGKVDGVRLPKEIFYVSRVMQSDQPDLHIIGHWTYPGEHEEDRLCRRHALRPGRVVPQRQVAGRANKPSDFVDTYNGGKGPGDELPPSRTPATFTRFPNVAFAPGTLKAVATKGGKVVAQQELQTAGEPKAIKLTSTPARRACRRTAATWL